MTLNLSNDTSQIRARSDSFPLIPPPPLDNVRRGRSLTQKMPSTPRTAKNLATSNVLLRIFDNIDSDSNKGHSQSPPIDSPSSSSYCYSDEEEEEEPVTPKGAFDWRRGMPIESAMYKPHPNLPDEHIAAEMRKRAEAKLVKQKDRRSINFEAQETSEESGDNDEQKTLIPSAQSPRRVKLEAAMIHRQQSAVMSRYIQATNCGYSFTELYKCIEIGLTESLSEQFWVTQCLNSAAAPSLPNFDKLVTTALLPHRVFEQIMLDIYRTEVVDMPQDAFFLNNLYRGIIAHAALRPDIGYTQGMNIVWAHIVAVVSRPAHQLIIAEHIANQLLPLYYSTDLIGARIDTVVLKHFLMRRCTNLEARMREKWGDVDLLLLKFVASNYTTLFVDRLRGKERRRLWDLLMFRGAVVLIEFSLQLFIHGYTIGLLDQSEDWPYFADGLEKLLPTLTSLDAILSIQVPNGHIVQEDFTTRRRAATRSVFSELGGGGGGKQ